MSELTIGFIGLGVMGGPMCRNIANKHAGRVIAFDLNAEALEDLSDTKAEPASSIEALASEVDIVCLSLPGGPQVQSVSQIIAGSAKPGTIVIDLSTTTVASARETASELKKHEMLFADAPVARTREAAQQGKLSIMVGSSTDLFRKIEPVLNYMASDVTYGGDVGAGQVLKLVNNMLVFANTVALAEMVVLGEKAGVDADTLMDAVSKGSGDSFVLRNHGRKSMAPRNFPEKSFPPEYVLKDIGYVLQLAEETGVEVPAARIAQTYYETSSNSEELRGRYFPGVIKLVEDGALKSETK